jgi:hypothetical protein
MNPTRAQRGLWLAVIANSVAITGCQESRLQTEIDRLQVQLKQADERVAVATAQIEVANTQIAVLGQSLEQARAETAQAKSDAAQQVAATHENAALEKAEIERQNAKTVAALDSARRDLAAARSQLDEIARKKSEAQQERAVIGIWEIAVGPDTFRFAFYPDGSVPVLQRNPRSGAYRKGVAPRGVPPDMEREFEWITPNIVEFNAGRSRPKTHYSYRRSAPNAFAIRSYDELGDLVIKEGVGSMGIFVVNPDGSAKVKLGDFTPDEFGKPTWYVAKKIGDVEQVNDPAK